MREQLQKVAMQAADLLVAARAQPIPPQAVLDKCRIISHRGENDNITVIENTLPAFDIARDNGVWGIECDLRWTRDLVPVISHDACGSRLFACPRIIATLTAAELRREMPMIPTLAELLARYTGQVHVMLEIKREAQAYSDRQKAILREHLAGFTPGIDYHLLALAPELYDWVDFLAPEFFILVAELNVARLSSAALERGFGGLTGHFLLLNNRLKQRHEQVGQRIGTGFVRSSNCLFRELNRGVEWIFSNDAVAIQHALNARRS